MSMQLILVVPELLARSPAALAAAPSLVLLDALAPAPRVEYRGIATALVGALGAAADTPIAPLAALGAGIDPGDGYLLIADPVFLMADRDDVVLVDRVDDLVADDAQALASTLNRHFAGDGVQFEVARPDAWFLRCAEAPGIETTPFDMAYRHGIYPHLPRGTQSATWNRWQSEIQMLLHTHPVNAAREASGCAPVNGVWFWGGGRLDAVGRLPVTATTAGGGRAGDLARGIARASGGAPRIPEPTDTALHVIEHSHSVRGVTAAIVVTSETGDDAAVTTLESYWLAPALTLLSRHRIDAIHLVADGNGAAAHWTATPPTLWTRLVAGARRKPFAVPTPALS